MSITKPCPRVPLEDAAAGPTRRNVQRVLRATATAWDLDGGFAGQAVKAGPEKERGLAVQGLWNGVVERRRIELPTFALRTRRSPS